jgi:hypothetical protein
MVDSPFSPATYRDIPDIPGVDSGSEALFGAEDAHPATARQTMHSEKAQKEGRLVVRVMYQR